MQYDIFNYRHIIWDFNGTLLDDIGKAVDVMNMLLKRRNMQLITLDSYLEHFDFPVIDYYRLLGFDLEKENFKNIAEEFILGYFADGYSCYLQKGAKEVLFALSQKGISQSVLSASFSGHLERYLNVLGIRGFFMLLSGQDDIQGSSKEVNGYRHMDLLNMDPADVIYIGDTVHDLEVANSIKCDHLLVANGHHKKSKLLKSTDRVIDSLTDLL
jgi:phosphoglycolate phosphatase